MSLIPIFLLFLLLCILPCVYTVTTILSIFFCPFIFVNGLTVERKHVKDPYRLLLRANPVTPLPSFWVAHIWINKGCWLPCGVQSMEYRDLWQSPLFSRWMPYCWHTTGGLCGLMCWHVYLKTRLRLHFHSVSTWCHSFSLKHLQEQGDSGCEAGPGLQFNICLNSSFILPAAEHF